MIDTICKFIPEVLPPCIAQVIGRGKPIDMGIKFIDGKRLIGDGKTIIGTFGSIIITFFIMYVLCITHIVFKSLPLKTAIILSASLTTGSMLGDISNSFIKRRINIRRGGKFIGDNINSPIGSFITAYIVCSKSFIAEYNIYLILLIILFVGFMHYPVSILAYKIGIKKERW